MDVSVLLDIEENPSGFVPFFSAPVLLLLVITVDVDENVVAVVRAVVLPAVVLSLSNVLILSFAVACVSSAEEWLFNVELLSKEETLSTLLVA